MHNGNQEIDLKKEILARIVRAFFSHDFKERSILKVRVIAGLGFAI
ncbi:hypothetical protein [Candidatus Endomicrobiellum trichonymphae]|nr:hypothetical protein [Candidatus Endomicrobium trichonymphae]